MSKIKIVVAKGIHLRNPKNGQPLKAGVNTVENNSFWRRRIKDGDVTLSGVPVSVSIKRTEPKQKDTSFKTKQGDKE